MTIRITVKQLREMIEQVAAETVQSNRREAYNESMDNNQASSIESTVHSYIVDHDIEYQDPADDAEAALESMRGIVYTFKGAPFSKDLEKAMQILKAITTFRE